MVAFRDAVSFFELSGEPWRLYEGNWPQSGRIDLDAMRSNLVTTGWTFSLALMLLGTLGRAQDADAVLGSANGWQRYDWLSSADAATTGGKLASTASHEVGDPFTVVTNGALWQEKYGATYAQSLGSGVQLSYEMDAVTLNEDSQSLATAGTPDDLSHGQKASLQFQPAPGLTFGGNVHSSSDDAGSPESSVETRGAGLSAETRLPFNSVLTLSADSDTTSTGSLINGETADNSYDAQLKQPLGKLPLTAVTKGHYEETSENGNPTSSLPSIEQSLVWKPADATTVQMGLRQQHYQNFPGITNQLNETLFADWSQSLLPEITWHSYAEVLNARDTQDVAPAVPTASGANGTAQSADPTNNLSMPNSLTDETVTFSTGPSFKLDRDVSASVEYSDRFDPSQQPGNAPTDQRVSVSLKGSF